MTASNSPAIRRRSTFPVSAISTETSRLASLRAVAITNWAAKLYSYADSERQRSDVPFLQTLRLALCGLGGCECRLKVRQHHAPEFGQVGVRPLAPEERAPEFGFKLLHGTGEGRLRHPQFFSRAREVEVSGDRQEIADLMHFHAGLPVHGPPSFPACRRYTRKGREPVSPWRAAPRHPAESSSRTVWRGSRHSAMG